MSGHGPGAAMRSLLRPAGQATYEKAFGTVYVALMTNLLLAAACAPLLLALAIVRDPLASWPFFAALSSLCAPALAGAFSASPRWAMARTPSSVRSGTATAAAASVRSSSGRPAPWP